jgi:hypothetical protein
VPKSSAPATTTELLALGSTVVSTYPTVAHASAARTKSSALARRSALFRRRDYAALALQMVLKGQ